MITNRMRSLEVDVGVVPAAVQRGQTTDPGDASLPSQKVDTAVQYYVAEIIAQLQLIWCL